MADPRAPGSSAPHPAPPQFTSASRAFASWNEAMVERYDIERYYERAHPLVRWIERRRVDALLALARPVAGDRVLEVGCGAGHVLERFAGARRTGLDISPRMLDRARRRLGQGVPLICASADALPFRAGSFPVSLCTEVLEHTPDPSAVLRELVRVAGGSGRIVVSVPNETMIDRVKRVLRSLPLLKRLLATLATEANEWHLHRMGLPELRQLAGGTARIERMRAVPARLLPVRYVALLRSSAE